MNHGGYRHPPGPARPTSPTPPPAAPSTQHPGPRVALLPSCAGCHTRSTQDEPAFCGLASLAMTLNALSIDPRRTWKVRAGGSSMHDSWEEGVSRLCGAEWFIHNRGLGRGKG